MGGATGQASTHQGAQTPNAPTAARVAITVTPTASQAHRGAGGGARRRSSQPASLPPSPEGPRSRTTFDPPPRPAPSQTRLPCLYASTPGPQATPMRRPPPTPLPPAFPPQPPRYQRHPHEGGGGGAARRVNGPQLPPRACAGQNARLLLHRRLRSPSQGRKKIEKKQ